MRKRKEKKGRKEEWDKGEGKRRKGKGEKIGKRKGKGRSLCSCDYSFRKNAEINRTVILLG